MSELDQAQAAVTASLYAIENGEGDSVKHAQCLAQLQRAEAAAERERAASDRIVE